MTFSEEKKALRTRYRQERRERFEDHNFLNLVEIPEVKRAQIIASYFSINDEPSTSALNAHLISAGKTILLPAMQGDEIIWRKFDGEQIDLSKKIPESVGEEFAPQSIELIFVPALRVDRRGYRLGRGGGHYDRALAKLNCWSCALVHPDEISSSDLPNEEFDVPVKAFATPHLVTRIRS